MNAARWIRVAWWIMPLAYVLLLVAPSVTLPGDELGIRRFHTPPLSVDMRLGQTFSMTADGLRAIEVAPIAVDGRVSGSVRFELHELRDGAGTLVRSGEVWAQDLIRGGPYRFEFPPILDSKDRTYRLDLLASSSEGVALWATKGERYDGGRLHANGRERWADLTFRVHAPAPPVWGRLMSLRQTNPVRASLVIAAFLTIWLLLGLVLRGLVAALPEPGHTDAHMTGS